MKDFDDVVQEITNLVDQTQWDLRYSQQASGLGLGDDHCRIYLVLTQTGWYAHASISIRDLLIAEEKLALSGLTHDDVGRVVNVLINSFKDKVISTDQAEHYLAFVTYWFIGTDTFKQLKTENALKVHTFIFSYLAKNGSMFLRPSFAINNSIDFFEFDDVFALTRQVVDMDKRGTGHVGKQLALSGGAVLSPSLS